MIVQAAGGIVWRPRRDRVEVLVVHRPRYDDWTFPKGKLDRSEELWHAALREVWEETGFRCRITSEAGVTRYPTPGGDEKVVHYFAMRPREGRFAPNPEVDRIQWLRPSAATEVLTYPFDRALLADLKPRRWVRQSRLLVIRHAHAGERAAWEGDDWERGLTAAGRAQAAALADRFRFAGIERLVSSPYLRCRQTLEPLARALDLDIEDHPALSEGAAAAETAVLLEELAGISTALSTHGDVITGVMDRLARNGLSLDGPFDAKKGATWAIEVRKGRLRSAEYLPPPD